MNKNDKILNNIYFYLNIIKYFIIFVYYNINKMRLCYHVNVRVVRLD